MTDAAPSFKPPWAVVAWCDDRFIYIELPVKDGPPYIFKEALTNDGLNKALHLMRDARRKIPVVITGDYNAPIEAAKKHFDRMKGNPQVSEETRAHARDILRKLNLTRRK